jgi:hypothetical protein
VPAAPKKRGIPHHPAPPTTARNQRLPPSRMPNPRNQPNPVDRKIDQYPYRRARRKFKRRYRECPGVQLSQHPNRLAPGHSRSTLMVYHSECRLSATNRQPSRTMALQSVSETLRKIPCVAFLVLPGSFWPSLRLAVLTNRKRAPSLFAIRSVSKWKPTSASS